MLLQARTVAEDEAEMHVPPTGVDVFDRLMGILVLSLVSLSLILARIEHMTGITGLLVTWPSMVGLLAVYAYTRWAAFVDLSQMVLLSFWAVVMVSALTMLIQLAARSPFPLVDNGLARADRLLGFSTGAVVQWTSARPKLKLMLNLAYASSAEFVVVALLLPWLAGYPKDSRRYLLSVSFGVVITAAAFVFWPAVGPWVVYHYQPTQGQLDVATYVAALKSFGPVPFNFQTNGIVSFPSFHATLSVLSAVALWRIRPTRWPASLLAAATCISTITSGWHYLTDVVGGIAVAWVAHVIASRVVSAIESAPASGVGRTFAAVLLEEVGRRRVRKSGQRGAISFRMERAAALNRSVLPKAHAREHAERRSDSQYIKSAQKIESPREP